jgi:AraC-like DNA-binding protein
MSRRLYELVRMSETDGISSLFSEIGKRVSESGDIYGQEKSQIVLSVRNALCHAARPVGAGGARCAGAQGLRGEQDAPDDLLPLVADYSESDPIGKSMDDMRESALLLADRLRRMQNGRAADMHGAIIRHIEQNFADPKLCAASVAGRFGLSEKYVFGIVKAQTGRTMGEHLEQIRLAKAARLLEDTDAAISDVCREVGFNTANTFYKAFKRGHGVSPGAWRKKSR